MKFFGKLYIENPRLEILSLPWNWSVNHGQDLTRIANVGIDAARADGYSHILYLQADEIIDPNDITIFLQSFLIMR